LKCKHQLIDDQCLCSEAIHNTTSSSNWCDHNSGCYKTSKKLIAESLEKSKEAHDLLAACGMQLAATKDVISDLEEFVMRYVYGDTKSKTLADTRAAKWRAQKKKNTIQLVTDYDSLHQQLARANYLAYLLKHYKLQNHPSPITFCHHFNKAFMYVCMYQPWMASCKCSMPAGRSTQPPLPQSMPLPQEEMNSSRESSESEDTDSDRCNLYSGSCSDSESCNEIE